MALRHSVGWDPEFLARDRWLWPLRRAASALPQAASWPLHEQLDAVYARRLAAGETASLRFAEITPETRSRAGEALRPERFYDGWIATARVVPTRSENWHDLLNALCFATWPRSKLALHERQYRAQLRRLPAGASKLPPVRTREQDSLTLFDEGGLVVAALPEAAAALSETREQDFEPQLLALCATRAALLVPFGHALFEHMVEGVPCPGASARVAVLPSLTRGADDLLAVLDRAVSGLLTDPARFCAPREAMHVRLQSFDPRCPSASELEA